MGRTTHVCGKYGGANSLLQMSGKKEEEETVEILGKKYPQLADGAYDAIILGTGLKECMLSGMLAVFKGMKVRSVTQVGATCNAL